MLTSVESKEYLTMIVGGGQEGQGQGGAGEMVFWELGISAEEKPSLVRGCLEPVYGRQISLPLAFPLSSVHLICTLSQYNLEFYCSETAPRYKNIMGRSPCACMGASLGRRPEFESFLFQQHDYRQVSKGSGHQFHLLYSSFQL